MKRNGRGSRAEKKWMKVIHTLPCCLTGWDQDVHAAHIRYQTGMALKPPFYHCLPMRPLLHAASHDTPDFWPRAGFMWNTDNDPRVWAERLYECREHADMEALVRDMAERANLLFLGEIMRRIAA